MLLNTQNMAHTKLLSSSCDWGRPKMCICSGSSSGCRRCVLQKLVSTVHAMLLRPQTNLRCYISSFCSVGRIVESKAILLCLKNTDFKNNFA